MLQPNCGHVNLKHSKPPPNFGIVFAVPYKALRLIHVFKHPSGMPSASCEVLEKKRIPAVEGNKEAYDHIFASTSININHVPMLIKKVDLPKSSNTLAHLYLTLLSSMTETITKRY